MSGTNIICGVKACRYCKLSGCERKAIVLDKEGNCLNREIADGKDAADAAAQDAAEGVLVYGA